MQHTDYLKRALVQASIRQGYCAPNPCVGAVVVKNGEIIAEGYHLGPGQPHAEVMALEKAGSAAAGATIYVTLEPCCHFGRTPPCTELIKSKQLAEVYYGYADPNPVVAGKGEQQLREAGIPCEFIELAEINDFYKPYTQWTLTAKPYVTAKLALSLDGKIAEKAGKPTAITGPGLQEFTHQCRGQSDAILTTATTIANDDPQYTIRLGQETEQRRLYILDSQARTSPTAQVFKILNCITILHADSAPVERIEALKTAGADCVVIETLLSGGLDPQAVIRQIGEAGVHALWLEAGGYCFSQFVEAGVVDDIYLYQGLKVLGADAYSAFTEPMDLLADYQTVTWRNVDAEGLCHLTKK